MDDGRDGRVTPFEVPEMSGVERDRKIMRLRREGWSTRAIARRVGMRNSGSVVRALQRIEAYGPGGGRVKPW